MDIKNKVVSKELYLSDRYKIFHLFRKNGFKKPSTYEMPTKSISRIKNIRKKLNFIAKSE